MSAPVHDALLVSCVNGGGLFHVAGAAIEQLSAIDTSGVAIDPERGVLLARQSDLSNEVRRYRDGGWDWQAVTPHRLDLHDVLWSGTDVYAVGTEVNAVFRLDGASLREVERWTLPGEADSSHVNSVCLHHGRLLASRFGSWSGSRAYKGQTRGAGEVFDVLTGEVVVRGLSQPHSLVSHGGCLWLCDSQAHHLRCYRDGVELRSVLLPGYVRGLAFGPEGVHVGLSRSRNDTSEAPESASILLLDPDTLALRRRVALPVAEIYDIRVATPLSLAQLRRAALQEAHGEVARLRTDRQLAEQSASDAHGAARRFADALHAANLRAAALEREAADDAAAAAAVDRAMADATAWAAMQEADAAQLRARAVADAAQREAAQRWIAWAREADAAQRAALAVLDERVRDREGELAAIHGHLAALGRSRAWRAWGAVTRLRLPQPPVPAATAGGRVAPPDPGPAPPLPALDAMAAPTPPRRSALPILGLAFAADPAPRVSVVVAAYGRYEETVACLLSLAASGDAAGFEVILVDDLPGDEETARFASVPHLRYVRNDRNLGFLASANRGAALATGEFVVFLNNDTTVRRGWLDALLSTFAIFHECGIAGARLVYPDGRLQEAGGVVWSDGSGWNVGRDDDPDAAAYAHAREVDYVSGAALMIRRAHFEDLGGFDTRYAPAYYEDTDLAFRMRASGWRVYYQPAATVVHHEGLSHGTDPAAGGKAYQVRNRELFVERWRDVLARDQCRPGELPFLARDRGQLRQTVLVVDHRAPEPDHDAGSRAIWHLLRVLHVFGLNVTFWAMAPSADARYALNLRVHGVQLFEEGRDGTLAAWLAANGTCIDHVVLSRPLVAEACIDDVRRHSGAPVVLYGHDVHHQRLQRQYDVCGEPWLVPHIAHLRDVEEALWRRCDLILYPSGEETALVRQFLAAEGAPGRAETIPLFAYESLHAPVPPADARRDVLFVGSYAHAPNEDGAYWFATEAWPLVRERLPGLRLCLVGGGASERLQALACDDIVLAGQVSEATLQQHYDAACVAIAPLRFGAGLKGKLIEAMRHGVPCVTTSVGAQGLDAGGFLRVADAPEGFAAAVCAVARDVGGWQAASADAQAFVAARFSVHAVWEVLGTVMRHAPFDDVEARRAAVAAQVATTAARPAG